jgi:hypothetical protein
LSILQPFFTASLKLEIDGTFLVLENDGTVVDDSEALLLLSKETFLLLEKNEIWRSSNFNSDVENISSLSTCSTVTLEGNNSFSNESHKSNTSTLCVVELDSSQNFMISDPKSSMFSDKDDKKSSNMSENTWREFAIPWNKLTDNVLSELNEGKIGKTSRKKVIHMVVDEMRVINKSIANKSLRIIAHKIIDKFPLSFKDVDDDGIVLGDGSTTLFLKLQERNNYLNACLKRKRVEENINDNESSSSTRDCIKRRKNMYAKVGTSKWSGDFSGTDVNLDTIEDKVAQLKNMSEMRKMNEEELYQLLEQTYNSQREFLNRNDPPTIIEMRDTWPILLNEKGIFWHFNKLMGTDLNILEQNLKKKAQKIINYGVSKKIVTDENIFTDNDQCYKTIETIAILLKENIKLIISHLKVKFSSY